MALSGDDLWIAKLVAFLHDPPDKQSVLFDRSLGGHEKVAAGLLSALGIDSDTVARFRSLAEAGDRMASGADRAPQPKGSAVHVDFRHDGFIIHPLSGEPYQLESMAACDWRAVSAAVAHAVKEIAEKYHTEHGRFSTYQRRFLSVWRELRSRLERDSGDVRVGAMWHAFPADGRVPDHNIWDHLRLTSGLATALAGADGRPENLPALLLFTIGPVQGFIAAARKTQDLWAGSWILSWLAWRALLPVVEALGPDIVLFPDLWGQPLVDQWLVREVGLGQVVPSIAPEPGELARASFPNRFMAVVPAERAKELGCAAEQAVRAALRELGERSLRSAVEGEPEVEALDLVRAQLDGYFTTNWVAIPWPYDVEKARTALRAAFPVGKNGVQLPALELEGRLKCAGIEFWAPQHSGMLYGDFYHLVERCLGTLKRTVPFGSQVVAPGRRCTQTGELAPVVRGATRPGDHPDERIPYSNRLAPGEELSAVVLVKRELRRVFHELAGVHLDQDKVRTLRFPSTGSIAASAWLEELAATEPDAARELAALLERHGEVLDYGQAVPEATYKELLRSDLVQLGRLDARVFFSGEDIEAYTDEDGNKLPPDLQDGVRRLVKECGTPTPYYAVVVADGDGMGKWLSGVRAPELLSIYHPALCATLPESAQAALAGLRRPLSPALHAAVSGALRTFSGLLVPALVENESSGKLIYSGGDDVLAVLPLRDVATVLLGLPAIFAGRPAPTGSFRTERGFVRLSRGGIRMLMGTTASLSAGVVVAHQKAPLQLVLKAGRDAEKTAKNLREEKNAVAVRVLKHSGEQLEVCVPWFVQGSERDEEIWFATVLDDWVRAFGDGHTVEGHEGVQWVLSPTFVRAVELEIGPILDAAVRKRLDGGVRLAHDFFSTRARRDLAVVGASRGSEEREARRHAEEALRECVERLCAFVGAALASMKATAEPSALCGGILQVALFLARHRGGRRGRRRQRAEGADAAH